MATNFEFYKDEIQKCLSENNIAIKNNKPVKCVGDCNSCIRDSGIGICMDKPLFEWHYAEHIEPPKLTKRERAFCEAVQTGWLVRAGEYLYWHKVKPVEEESGSFLFPHTGDSFPMTIKTEGLAFDLIKNKEMLSVEDLLKLEVIEVQHETD